MEDTIFVVFTTNPQYVSHYRLDTWSNYKYNIAHILNYTKNLIGPLKISCNSSRFAII